MSIDERVKYQSIKGPYSKEGIIVEEGSVLEGHIQWGKDVYIGYGTRIISRNSNVILSDRVRIGDVCKIKVGDEFDQNNDNHIILGPGTIIENDVTIKNKVKTGKNVYLSKGVVLGRNIDIGDNSRLNEYAILGKNVTLGKGCILYSCQIGYAPQGRDQPDEDNRVEIGDNTVIREFVTINRGTEGDRGATIIGNNDTICAYTHIAHDCIIGDNTEIINRTDLAGHVHVGDHVRISGQVGIAPYVHVGSYSFIGGQSGVITHVLPFAYVAGTPTRLKRINNERIKRAYKNPDEILKQIKQAYKIIRNREVKKEDLVSRLQELNSEPVNIIVQFISSPLVMNFPRYLRK